MGFNMYAGLKKFSNWPTYPQLYINDELIGGLDSVLVCTLLRRGGNTTWLATCIIS